MTSSSGDYGIDIIGDNNNIKYGYQCKRYRKKIGVYAIQQALTGVKYYNLDIPVVITNSYFTAAASNLADNTEVLLIDRDRLFKMVKKTKSFYQRIPFYYHLLCLLITIGSFLLSKYYSKMIYVFGIFLVLNIFMLVKDLYYTNKDYYHNNIIIHEIK